MIKFNQIYSLIKTPLNLTLGKISFPKNDIDTICKMEDGELFKVFRHVIIKSKDRNKSNAVFIVRFKTKNLSAKANKRFSLFPIPLFIGLPGFLEKYWTVNEDTGFSQGIYQWKSKELAEKYSKSFAYKFMKRRSVINSVSFQIIENTNITEYVSRLKL